MTITKTLSPAVLLVVMALAATPAFAQHSRGGGSGQRAGGGSGQRSGGGGARSAQPAPAPRPGGGGGGTYAGPRAVPRQGPPPRQYGSQRYDNRNYGNRGGYYGNRGGYYGNHGSYYGNRGYGYRGYPGYGYRGYYGGYYGYGYHAPYYAFRPHFTIGFGLYLGYPVPYPYSYGYPGYVYGAPYQYGYPYPPDPNAYNGYPQSAPYNVVPQQGAVPPQGSYGGVSFEITPDSAAIYIDGNYVGVVRDFSPTRQPLAMTPGQHRIELQAQGMQPMGFDVNVVAGQVIPYRGTLQP